MQNNIKIKLKVENIFFIQNKSTPFSLKTNIKKPTNIDIVIFIDNHII